MSEAWLVLAGPTRTGTTSLFRHLALSSSLRASYRKETDYFLGCLQSGRAADIDEYLRLFAGGSGRCMEASPLYFAFGTQVAAQVAALPGDVKVLVTMREPVARFRSLVSHVQTKRNVGRPPRAADLVDDALAAVDLPPDAHDYNRLAFREGCYREVLAEWVAALGESRVRVVFFESLEREPGAVLPPLYDWLGLPPDARPPLALPRENESREVRARGLHRYAMQLNAWLEPVLNRLQGVRNFLRAVYYRINGETAADPLTPALATRLRDAYAVRNAGLRRSVEPLALGPLPDWVG